MILAYLLTESSRDHSSLAPCPHSFIDTELPPTVLGCGQCTDSESAGLQVWPFDIVDTATSSGVGQL